MSLARKQMMQSAINSLDQRSIFVDHAYGVKTRTVNRLLCPCCGRGSLEKWDILLFCPVCKEIGTLEELEFYKYADDAK
jgi:Zn finger protein HypA/HybF involved in hydrogenase expression